MKYKVGDRVRIKSIDWYNQMLAIKDKQAYRTASNGCEFIGVWCGNRIFKNDMIKFCGQVMTIKAIENEYYIMHEDTSGYWYCDEMIEGLVEEECPQDFIEKYCKSCGTQRCDRTKEFLDGCPYYNTYMCEQNNAVEKKTKPEPKFKVGDILFYRGETSGYLKVEEIREENGEIRYYETSRNIYLVENDPDVFADKVCSVETEKTKPIDLTVKGEEVKERIEIAIPEGYEYVIDSGKIIFTKKKKEYPKTFEDCVSVLMREGGNRMPLEQMNTFRKLIDARNAYWTIAGEEMGLGKPWEPDWNDEKQDKYGFYNEVKYTIINPAIFVFPTEEMRDAFKENFDPDIEICKKFL